MCYPAASHRVSQAGDGDGGWPVGLAFSNHSAGVKTHLSRIERGRDDSVIGDCRERLVRATRPVILGVGIACFPYMPAELAEPRLDTISARGCDHSFGGFRDKFVDRYRNRSLRWGRTQCELQK